MYLQEQGPLQGFEARGIAVVLLATVEVRESQVWVLCRQVSALNSGAGPVPLSLVSRTTTEPVLPTSMQIMPQR
jgi:hypothetical protein